jgi:hypothetical protein
MNPRLLRFVVTAVLLMLPLGTAGAQQWWSNPSPGAPPGDIARPSVVFDSIADPIGDTFGSVGTQLDITFFSAVSDGVTLTIDLTFAGTISHPATFNPDALFGFIDLDTDQNPATGVGANTDSFCPAPSGLGIEYYVDTTGAVIDPSVGIVGAAPMTYTTNSVSAQIPLALLGGDDGIVDVATVIGNVAEPTDCAPNGGFITSNIPAVPTLPVWTAAVMLLALLLIGAIALRQRSAEPLQP